MGRGTPPRTYACTAKRNVSKPPWGVGSGTHRSFSRCEWTRATASLTLVDLLAPDPGLQHHGLVDLLHLNGEDVAVEDYKAGLEALGDLAQDVLVGS
jgi:hypothetical protein